MKRILSRLVVTLLLVIGVATLTLRSTPVGGELLNYAAIGVWYKPRQLWSAKTACDENLGHVFLNQPAWSAADRSLCAPRLRQASHALTHPAEHWKGKA